MGSLSNLYISQSYQSLIHLGTDNALVSGTYTELQDGIGQTMNVYFDGRNISSSGNIYGANILNSGSILVTASVAVNVLTFTKGDGSTFNLTVAASGSVVPGTISGSAQITALGFVSSSVTASSLITASAIGNTITFTKGDSTTFNVSVSSTSIDTSSFATTGSNQFNGSQSISGSVTLSGSLNNVNYIDFNTASIVPAWQSGRVFWDNTDGCLGVYNAEADITLQVGQEMWVRARNNTGVTIANGAAVRLVGALGDNPLIVLAQSVQVSGSAITDNQILGLATHTIETGTDGYVTTLGNVRGLNTSAYAQGDVLFVSSSAGLLTNVIPVAPYERIPVATVVKVGPGGSGILYVAPQPPIDFSDLSSVLIEGDYANDDVWIYEGNVWKHKSKSDIGLTTTSSFNAYTSSNDAKVNSLIAATGSYATTGSNNFVGQQTLTDVGFVNQITLDDHSGSLVLFAKGYTSSSLTHISGSNASISASVGNLIFKTNNNTADTILTGSNNIFVNPLTPTAGFKRYIGGSNNIFMGPAGVPQISGSMQFSPSMNANMGPGAYTFRGPVSSSAWNLNSNLNLGNVNLGTTTTLTAEKLTSGLTMTSNALIGGINIFANQAFLTGSTTSFANNIFSSTPILVLSSSAAQVNNNIINDTSFVITNQFYSSSVGLGQLQILRNTIGGSGNTLIVSGSQPTGTTSLPVISENLVGGAGNILYSDIGNVRTSGTTAYNQISRNIIFGQGLIITGSGNTTDTSTVGSAFFGRFNDQSGSRGKTSDTIFAIGAGTSTSARKNVLTIDSGSNSFFEGVVSISGSLLVNGIAPAAIATGSFATTGSNLFIGNQTITGSVSIQGQTTFTLANGDTSNVRIGSNAMGNAITNGNGINVAIGNSAMQNTSGSSQNVAIGNRALFKTVGGLNVSIGSETLTENTTGANNIAIGVNALNLNTTASDNLAFGINSMQFTSGSAASNNVGIGANTLQRNQADSQIAIGADALKSVTVGNANTAIGRLALQNTTTGVDNLGIGANTLYSNESGERNIAIGTAALRNAAVNASYNIGIGVFSLYSAKDSNNVAIGHAAFENLQSGSQNTAIGWTAGYNVTTGYYNTLIGANLRGESNWNSVVAISDGNANIKFFNSGSQTTLTNNTLVSGSLTTTGSVSIGTTMQLTPLDPLPAGTIGMLAVSSSNELYFYNGAWTLIV